MNKPNGDYQILEGKLEIEILPSGAQVSFWLQK